MNMITLSSVCAIWFGIKVFSLTTLLGGGTAGCVLANRLSTSPGTTVLLVERGPVADSWTSRVPLLSSDFASDGSRTQKRDSTFQPEISRTVELCTGSVLGGSSRVNQMIYTRGLRQEYDQIKEVGLRGWGWEDVKGLFMKSEKALGPGEIDQDVHGVNGATFSGLTKKFVTQAQLFFRGVV